MGPCIFLKEVCFIFMNIQDFYFSLGEVWYLESCFLSEFKILRAIF